MDELTLFDIFERLVVCLTPIILAVIGLSQSRAQKKSEEYMRAQEELSKAKKEIDERDKKELEEHFSKLENSIDSLGQKFEKMDETVANLSNLDKQLTGLIELSRANLELCQSLSNIVSGIGDALDSTDIISSGNLKDKISEHRAREQELTTRMFKIMY